MVYHLSMPAIRRIVRQPSAIRAGRRRLRGLAFALLYGRGAPYYDRFTDWLFLGEWGRWRETVFPLLPETGLVVELGAGTGRLATAVQRPGRTWIATEPSASMLATAPRPLGEGVWMVRAGAAALPLPDGVVDAVVATFPTSYILGRRTADEIRRVLAPCGKLVVVVEGELKADGGRRQWRRKALSLFYGSRQVEAAENFGFPGFDGGVRLVPTLHGEAMVYVGVRAG